MDGLLHAIETYGISVVLAAVFIIWIWREKVANSNRDEARAQAEIEREENRLKRDIEREEKLEKIISDKDEYIKNTLISLVTETREALTKNTAATKDLSNLLRSIQTQLISQNYRSGEYPPDQT